MSPHLLFIFVYKSKPSSSSQPRGSTNITKEIEGFKTKYDMVLKIQRDAMQLDAVPDQHKPKGMEGCSLKLHI